MNMTVGKLNAYFTKHMHKFPHLRLYFFLQNANGPQMATNLIYTPSIKVNSCPIDNRSQSKRYE